MRNIATVFLIIITFSLQAQWSLIASDYNTQTNSDANGFFMHCFNDSLVSGAIWEVQRPSNESFSDLVSVNKNGSNVGILNLYRSQVPMIPTGLAWSNTLSYMVLYDTTSFNLLPTDRKFSRQIDFRDALTNQTLWTGSGIFRIPELLEKKIYVFGQSYFWLIDYKNDHLLKLSTIDGDTVQSVNVNWLRSEFGVDSSYSFHNIQFKGPEWQQSDTVFASADFIKYSSGNTVLDSKNLLALIDLNSLKVVSQVAGQVNHSLLDTERNLLISDTVIVDWSKNEFDRYVFGYDLLNSQKDTLLVVRSSKFNPDTANAYYKHSYLYRSRGDYSLYAEYVEDNLPNHPIFQYVFSLNVRLHLYKNDTLIYRTSILDTTYSSFYDTFLSDIYLFSDGACLLNLRVASDQNEGRILMVDSEGKNLLAEETSTSNKTSSLKVFPTLVESIIQVVDYSLFTEVKIYSSSGKIVFKGSLNTTNTKVNLSHLKPGIYTMLFEGEGTATIRSIVKK